MLFTSSRVKRKKRCLDGMKIKNGKKKKTDMKRLFFHLATNIEQMTSNS